MKQPWRILFGLAILPIAFGCASPNVNPPEPRANTGYVDLYSTTDADLCWEVRATRVSNINFKTVFSDVKPVKGDVLRLSFTPGDHRLRIAFLNRVVTKPAEVTVAVENGRVTPVRIVLNETGATTVLSKQTTMGGTPSGRGGRRTKINSDETVSYTVSAITAPAISYQPKEQMPYINQTK